LFYAHGAAGQLGRIFNPIDPGERMTDDNPHTGDSGTFGRFVETPVDDMSDSMREAYDTTLKLRGLVPGPHKIWLANPTLLTTIVPTGGYFQTESSLSKAEIEITTNVINGHWGAAYSNHEHEIIGIGQGHLPADKVAALIAGLPTSFVDSRQQVVYELAFTLAAARVIPQGLFRRAQELLGDAGIVDVTVLMGWFTAVSLTLMAYDVPSNAVGLDQ
jgi:4-carboxymuconolactone decarboxylase